VQAISVDAAIQDWLRFRETNGLGNDKPKLMGGKLLTWCKANSVTFLYQLTSDKVIHFRNSLPYKTKTSSSLKIHWAIICNFFGWAHGIGLVPKNPVPNTRVHPQFKIRFKKPEVVPPTTDENDRAFPQTQGWLWICAPFITPVGELPSRRGASLARPGRVHDHGFHTARTPAP
jgi:hypothetical protein